MTEIVIERLNIQSGLIEAVVLESQVTCEVSISIRQWSLERKEEFVSFAAKDAHLLYDLLQKNKIIDLAGWFPVEIEELVASSTCSCEDQDCKHVTAVLSSVKQLMEEQSDRGLLLVGYSASECTAAVFARWSASLPDAQGTLAATVQRLLDEKGPSASSPGEWLYEAALQEQLHEPGSGLHDVKIDLTSHYKPRSFSAGKANIGSEERRELSELLPGIPEAEKALQLVRLQTSELAGTRRKLIKGKLG